MLLCLVLLMAAAAPALTVFAVSIPACDCTETSSDLTVHADSCARKSYVRSTYIQNNTAAQIYADWNSLASDVQAAILTFLGWDNYAKLAELQALIEAGSSSGGYPTTGSENIAVDLSIPTGAFPEGTVPSIEPIDAKEYCSDIESAIYDVDDSTEVLALYAFDISFINNGNKIQPAESVEITFTVPAELVPDEAQVVYIFHVSDDGTLDGLGGFYNIDLTSRYSYTVMAESFSSYVLAYTGKNYQAPLLKDALAGDPDYSIVTIPATLYDYADSFDSFLKGKANGNNYFYFWTGGSNPSFRPNDGAAAATMGILQDSLDANGLPHMAYGYDNGKYIFDTNDYTGKTVYDNVDFEFIYDKETGYYEYDSSLNHAQLNGNTVQLYTDTMGPYNFYSAFAIKDGGISYDQIKSISGTYPAIKFTTSGADPKVELDPIDTEITDKNKYLYIRMHSNATETNGLSLYLDIGSANFNENHKITLDMKNGWNEYFFDLSSYKGKTLQRIRIDPGTKANVTVQFESIGFANASNTLLIDDMAKAGFFPFIDIADSYPSIYTEFDIDNWKSKLGTEYTQRRATRAYYNQVLSGYDACPTDPLFHFGVSMEFECYIPVDRQTDYGDDIIFQFTGDDDLWVFVDGKLALDVGGAHTEVSGTLNFTDGTIKVSKARSITSDTTVTTAGPYSGILDDALRSPGYHTIKIFYLERASTGSNCRFYFNLPTVPTGDVEVSKEVVDDSGLVDIDALEFDYSITVNNAVYANKAFQVVTYDYNGNPLTMEKRTTSSYGGFTLKHNQKAFFNDIDENMNVVVRETPDSRFTTMVNNAFKYEASGTTGADTTVSFDFVNTVILTSIVVEKTASPISSDVDEAENQSFIFHVQGTDADGFNSSVDVLLVLNISEDNVVDGAGSNSATITNIPLGYYTVTEDPNWSWRYEPVEGSSATIVQEAVEEGSSDYSENNYFKFENERKEIYWLSGDNIALNRWDGTSVRREDDTE